MRSICFVLLNVCSKPLEAWRDQDSVPQRIWVHTASTRPMGEGQMYTCALETILGARSPPPQSKEAGGPRDDQDYAKGARHETWKGEKAKDPEDA